MCIVTMVLAPSGDRAVPASLANKSDFCVGRTLQVGILLPQCLLQAETERCPHCLTCCIVTMMLAPSGDRAVPASLNCLFFVLQEN